MFDTLVWRDANGNLVPALVSTWVEAADRRSVEFTLRPEARPHDGKPVTAADVVFTFGYFRVHRHNLFDVGMIDGAADLSNGRVRVKLKRSYAPLVPQLAGLLPILPKHVVSPGASERVVPRGHDKPWHHAVLNRKC